MAPRCGGVATTDSPPRYAVLQCERLARLSRRQARSDLDGTRVRQPGIAGNASAAADPWPQRVLRRAFRISGSSLATHGGKMIDPLGVTDRHNWRGPRAVA